MTGAVGGLLDRVVERGVALEARLPRPEVLLGWLVAAHVVVKLLLLPLVAGAPPFGDEQAYANGAMALSNAVRDLVQLSAPDAAELDRNVVSSGWFMPGMSLVLAPLYLVVPDADPWAVRCYLGLFSLVLYVAALRRVARTLGPRWAVVVAAFPGLVPSWVLLGYGAYGDLAAGLVLVVLVMRLLDLFRGLRDEVAPSPRDGVVLGLLGVAALYLRSSTTALLAGIAVVAVVCVLVLLRGAGRRRGLASLVVAAALLAALVAPWSVWASHVLGARVVTTTTVPTVLATSFGDRDEVCFGRCDRDSTQWFRPLRYAREVARETGTSEVEVLPLMADHALGEVTLDHYFDRVGYNLASYALQPATFVDHLTPPGGRGAVGTVAAWTVKIGSWLVYFPVLLLAAGSLLSAARRSLAARLLDVVVKLVLGALLLQPFVHLGGGRYWTTAGPFFALAAATFLRERLVASGRMPGPVDGLLGRRDAAVATWLARIQVVLVVAVAAVVVAIVLALLA